MRVAGGLRAPDDEDHERETFDFSHPEDVFFYVVEAPNNRAAGDWKDFAVDDTLVISDFGVTGAATYENSYGGFLNYTLEGVLDCPKREGIFVCEGMTGAYHKGDGWMTDDDMDFYPGPVREATIEEIAAVWCGNGSAFWASCPENVA